MGTAGSPTNKDGAATQFPTPRRAHAAHAYRKIGNGMGRAAIDDSGATRLGEHALAWKRIPFSARLDTPGATSYFGPLEEPSLFSARARQGSRSAFAPEFGQDHDRNTLQGR